MTAPADLPRAAYDSVWSSPSGAVPPIAGAQTYVRYNVPGIAAVVRLIT